MMKPDGWFKIPKRKTPPLAMGVSNSQHFQDIGERWLNIKAEQEKDQVSIDQVDETAKKPNFEVALSQRDRFS